MTKKIALTKRLLQSNPAFMVLIVFISILFVLLHIGLLGESVYWWSPDSASYIEAARNYSAMGSLVISTGINNINDTAPISLWPPGYPLLLSFIQDVLGIDSQWVAVLISILSWMIVPSIIFALTRPLLGVTLSALLSILVLTSPAALNYGWMGLSDMPFLLIVLLGIFFSCRMNSGQKYTFGIFVGGVLLGISFSIRNIGAAALIAVFISYIITYTVRYDHRREIFFKIVVWGIGSSIIVIPVFIRNIMTFGTIQPYSMAPSTVSLLTNIRTYLSSTIYDLFGSRELARFIAWDFIILISIVVMAIGLTLYFYYRYSEDVIKRMHGLLYEFRKLTPNLLVLIVIFIYLILGMTIVIYARTKYEWGEPIHLRHVMQYDWAIIAITFFLLLRLIGEYHAKIIIFSLSTLMLCGHVYYASVEYYINEPKINDQQTLKYKIYNDNNIKKEVVRLSNQGLILASNFHDVLRIQSSVPIRRLHIKGNEQLAGSLKNQLLIFQKRLRDIGKDGRVFIFEQKDTLDKLMEYNILLSTIKVERRNETLLIFQL